MRRSSRQKAKAELTDTKRKRKEEEEESEDSEESEVIEETTSKKKKAPAKRVKRALVKENDDSDFEDPEVAKKNRKRKRVATKKAKKEDSDKDSNSDSDFEPSTKRTNKKSRTPAKKKTTEKKGRATKKKKGEEAKPKKTTKRSTKIVNKATEEMRAASANTLYRVGAHVSINGGIHNAAIEVASLGGNCFACFLSSSRTWAQKKTTFTQEEVELFNKHCAEAGIDKSKHILPHGSYLMNLGNPNAENLKKSRDLFLIELKRCKQLGISMYNFHPGSHLGEVTEEECLSVIADSINIAHKELGPDSNVSAIIECTAGQGTNVGYKFEHLRDIIAKVTDKSKVGVCLDTCHMFAAGYDLTSEESTKKVFEEFDSVVGWNYLRALHINDSKGEKGCKKDRHECLGKGKIGLSCFKYIMTEPKFQGIPLILETPDGDLYAQEIHTLFSMTKKEEQEVK